MKARILIVDDDQVSRQLFRETLESEGYCVDLAQSAGEALSRLREDTIDLLLTDVRMPGTSGLDLTRTIHNEQPDLPIIVMTAFGSLETAIEAIHEGAFDFISKPMNLEELKKIVSRALAQQDIQAGRDMNGNDGKTVDPTSRVIGKTSAMMEVFKIVARVATTKSTALILGESGTGKELIARAIHDHSPRAARRFVAVDCGALTETLLESELFGHVRGAFTGALSDKKGVFEEAEGGTCFLDEIGDISLNMQAKLLRVLQEHEIRRVGGKDWSKVDVRVVAATNRNLAELVAQGVFRQDLYYRLNVVAIHLPPLRERVEDIPLLARYFLQRYSRENEKSITEISDEAMGLLSSYRWPGNIRQLENAIEQAVALSNQTVLTADDLPKEVRDQSTAFPELPETDGQFELGDMPSLEEVKKRYILFVLRRTGGNMSRAAKLLNVDRRSLYRMIARYKIEPFLKHE